MADNLGHALKIQEHLVGLAEAIKRNNFDRSYLAPDGKGYALAIQGEGAKAMDDFMKSVGRYLLATQHGRGDKKAAWTELLKVFEEWLAKQKL
ncbi:MAG TPA: hypothetical protein VNX28_03460 [Gemmataceae bacterium]|jgi:hypothetical protein|nr:hypothetical protein [Gemmataceae bacterium]